MTKTILLYAWGVFLAAVTGLATVAGIGLVTDYIHLTDKYVFYISRSRDLPMPPSFFSSVWFLDLLPDYRFLVTVLGFAVAVWTFERWRQRQRQIQTERRP